MIGLGPMGTLLFGLVLYGLGAFILWWIVRSAVESGTIRALRRWNSEGRWQSNEQPDLRR